MNNVSLEDAYHVWNRQLSQALGKWEVLSMLVFLCGRQMNVFCLSA